MHLDWNIVTAFGLGLPGTELSTSYGRPALKIRGKAFAATGKTDDHFVLLLPVEDVEMLIATEPHCFFQTPHYEGWPAVLVRYESADETRVLHHVERAWFLRASQTQRRQREETGRRR